MCSIWQESYICEAKWLFYKIRMGFEFKLLVGALKQDRSSWKHSCFFEKATNFCTVENPFTYSLSPGILQAHFMNICVLQNVGGNCPVLQFLLFSCVYVLIIFLHQTAFGLLSCRVIHRYLSIEFGCCFFSSSLVECIHSQQWKCSALKILRVELNHSLPET